MTLFAALFAGLTVYLAAPGVARSPTVCSGRELPRWLRPRPDALRPRLRLTVGAGAGLVGYLLAEPLGPLAVVIGGVVLATTTVVLGHLEPPSVQRARDQRIQDLPEALDLLGSCLASGLPLRRAVREVAAVTTGPVGEDLKHVVSLVDVGVGERPAWLTVAKRSEWAATARDIARAADSGTGLQDVLVHHALRARKQAQAARQQRARTLGVRSVWPLMLCFLPAFVVLGIVPTVGSMVTRVLRLE